MTGVVLLVAAQAVLAVWICWGILHEDKLIRWEDCVRARIRRRRSRRRIRKATEALLREGMIVIWRDAPQPERDRRITRTVEKYIEQQK